jgi:mannose-6-phosphate isomerase
MEILFIEPIFKQRIWGGNKLEKWFGYSLPFNHVGECWAISAHKNGETFIKNGQYKGWSLRTLWQDHPEIFANTSSREFPLIIKILDAKDDLSVQVHPNDDYALKYENDLGKTECWYILEAEENSSIIYGHNATNIEQFKNMVEQQQWNKLLKQIKVKTNDFYAIPAGTVHAIKSGLLVYEVQQSSDTTYRLFDYDRTDDNGKKRELHLNKAYAVIDFKSNNESIDNRILEENQDYKQQQLIKNNYFRLQKVEVYNRFSYNLKEGFLLASVIAGSGTINNIKIKQGDSFIIPHNIQQINIEGKITIMLTSEN